MRSLDSTLARTVNADSPDLERFRQAGGKLVQDRGTAPDSIVASKVG